VFLYIYIYIYIFIYLFILMKDLSISLIKHHEYKVLQNHSHMLWRYIDIDINKILKIKYYLWLLSSANLCTKIVKKQICLEQTRFKSKVAKYPKNLFKLAVRDNHSHLTNIHLIDRCIAKRSKLLIWSENTCKQKKKVE
jgi:hypothetical protein